jgi:hypothetical protein
MDLVIFAGWLVTSFVVCWVIDRVSRRTALQQIAPVVVPVAVRLAEDHCRRVHGTHVSAVRPRDRGVGGELTPRQRELLANWDRKRRR